MKLGIGKCWGLLIFDLIGLAIAGYAYLLGFQILQTLPYANAFIILMAFFVGIKIVILSLYDLNRNLMLKNIPFIAGSITILGNAIIFGISFFLIPEVPYYFFIGLAVVDFVIISLGHFLWWIIIGKEDVEKKPEKEKTKKNKKESKEKLLSQNSEEDEYDNIFDALLEKNQNKPSVQEEKDTLKPPISSRNIFEEEKKYETGEFLKDIRKKRNLSLEKPTNQSDKEFPIEWEIESNSYDQVEPQFEPDESMPGKSENVLGSREGKLDFKENNFEKENEFEVKDPLNSPLKKKAANMPHMFEIDKEFILDKSPFSEKESEEERTREQLVAKSEINFEIDDENNFQSIEKRLGLLFNEIETSMKETHYLKDSISVFDEEVVNYKPIKGDEKIIAAGSLIREKLKAIIDKQFVVDEVLDDLIHLSKVINKRIDDLDRIEAGLNKRKVSLDQKEEILIGKNKIGRPQKLEILPEELVVENLDSEYIVAEEDYETIQRYLKRIK